MEAGSEPKTHNEITDHEAISARKECVAIEYNVFVEVSLILLFA